MTVIFTRHIRFLRRTKFQGHTCYRKGFSLVQMFEIRWHFCMNFSAHKLHLYGHHAVRILLQFFMTLASGVVHQHVNRGALIQGRDNLVYSANSNSKGFLVLPTKITQCNCRFLSHSIIHTQEKVCASASSSICNYWSPDNWSSFWHSYA